MEYVKDKRFKYIVDSEVEGFLQNLDLPRVAIDTETHYVKDSKKVTRFLTDKDSPNNTPFLITLSDGVTGWGISCNKNTLPFLKKYLEDATAEKIFFNAAYDLEMLLNEGIWVQGKIHDVMLLHHLLDEEDINEDGTPCRGLKALSVKYLQSDSDTLEKLVSDALELLAKERGIQKHEVSYFDVFLECPDLMIDYACCDTLLTMQLFNLWEAEIDKQGLRKIYEIEMDCIWAVVHTEMRGYKIDKKRLRELKKELAENVRIIEQEIYELVGQEFNINSDEQLVEAFNLLGAQYQAMTEKGNWQTNKYVLKPLTKHENVAVAALATAVLRYREEDKILNTFVAGIERYLQADGRVHASFWQAGTRTGRMSSSKPNFQNFIKDDRIKALFIPENGYILLAADAAQQEYRMLAHYAKEWTLIDMIKKGYDVHRATASLMYNIPYDDITDDQRFVGKTTNFSLVYGLGLAAIANTFGQPIDELKYKTANAIFRRFNLKPWKLPMLESLLQRVETEDEKEALTYYFSDECKEAIQFARKKKADYFRKLPNVQDFLEQAKRACQRRGWVHTWTGRRKRYKDAWREAYKAPNAIIQGGAGDYLKEKAGILVRFLRGKKSGIINYVHDAIYFEIHRSEVHLIPEIRKILEEAPFRVPIDFDLTYSETNEAEMKDWGDEA